MLGYYKVLLNYGVSTIPHKRYVEPAKVRRELPKLEVKEITLSQFDNETQDFITAHNIAEYRRKAFRMQLVPTVSLTFDSILKEVYKFEHL